MASPPGSVYEEVIVDGTARSTRSQFTSARSLYEDR